ncbi:hypothetical protein [Mycolicibacterium phocaicum]|uniref:hypothetical protein n=1 Tax=Mycolicibacterium phocaicum TaxID=319706 RepID=UPI00157FC042|nr:hypothetical protein [Mycolicibacterium phocaicum]
MKVRVVASVAVVVALYLTTIALYARTGLGHPSQISEPIPTADGTTVTICWPSLKMTMSASSVLMTMH